MEHDQRFMNLAFEEAKAAAERGEVPIGAVLVHAESGAVISTTSNSTIQLHDPTAHAEILAIRDGCRRAGAQRIPECDLYVTLEPCAMCAAAISFARIRRLVFAASDPKGGGVMHGGQFFNQPTCHHRPIVSNGLMGDECGTILREFFKSRR
jgi:tRNA(adenine34) deaminase